MLDARDARGQAVDGGLLAVHRTAEARSGQIGVARLEDEVTVIRLQRRGGRVELMAENPDYAPIVVNGPLAIEGLAVGAIRAGRQDRHPDRHAPRGRSLATEIFPFSFRETLRHRGEDESVAKAVGSARRALLANRLRGYLECGGLKPWYSSTCAGAACRSPTSAPRRVTRRTFSLAPPTANPWQA